MSGHLFSHQAIILSYKRNSFPWSEIISLVPEVAGISLGSRIFYKLVEHKARQNETGQSTGKKKTTMFLTSTL